MRNPFANESFTVEAGQTVSGIVEQPRTLRILSGRVWITVEGISQDYWLAAGDMLTVAPGRLIVVEADRHASRIDTQLAARQCEPADVRMRMRIGWLAQRFIRSNAAQAISKPPVVSMHRRCACA